MLQTKNLQKVFSKEKKIEFSDIQMQDNSVLLIDGPSGAGKTTLMKILTQLDTNYKGEYKTEYKQSEIGYFFHDYRLITGLSVLENIFLGNIYKNIGKTSIKKLSETLASKFGIQKQLHSSIKNLSAGQYQRVGLIRAFVGEKKLFILDEPVSHLDNESAELVFDYIYTYYQQGASFIISSHNNKLHLFLEEKIEKEKLHTLAV